MEPVSAVFGRRLRALRKARGLTQEELGRTVGLDYKHVGRIERGEFGTSFEAVQRLAEVLRVDYYELFLPDRLLTEQLEHALAATVESVHSVDPAALERYLRDLLNATRRFQASTRGAR